MTRTEPIIDLLRSFALRHYPQRVCDLLDALTVFPGDHLAALTKGLTHPDDEVRLLAVEMGRDGISVRVNTSPQMIADPPCGAADDMG